ncbi:MULTISPECIES: RNA-directed DNA polymerase [Spirulina sp. CCY15215]|uniref:RNA-directed DNA polymerase n=1 Tax=Spirulina sp. CCY15215 TaxID=2767591 RepID=UPI001950DA16|nr:RNA-directed DNA polymerase [Spirulina major]
MKPEKLAVRAINQYRRRDILAYLGLRYYLDNDCAKNDIWARDISTHLVQTRELPVYFRSYHFKKMADNNIDVVYRNIYLPGANEMFAESALLYECSLDTAFQALPCVYSYPFPDPSTKEGIFKNYFPKFQERNHSIIHFCKSSNHARVRYTDIKKFYPSISYEFALKTWRAACNRSKLSTKFRDLGEKLLTQYAEIAKAHNEGLGLLTGPMFSHLIANLVLFEVDRLMSKYMKGKYWRYVDDFVLAGDVEQIKVGRKQLSKILTDMGFSLHDEGKDFEVESTVWLKETNNIDPSKSKTWISLIANIKRFLIAKPEERVNLERAFSQSEIKISLLDYSKVVSESSYLKQVYDRLAKYSLTVDKLLNDALQAKNIYHEEINILLDKNHNLEGYARKQLISKLRFYAKRLSYLATSDTLAILSPALSNYPELLLESRVMRTLYSQDISSLIKLGANAVQAAAQILRIQGNPVTCSLDSFGEVELQGLAILRLNGIEIKFSDNRDNHTKLDPLNQFALDINSAELMRSNDLFIKEIACIRGVDKRLKHTDILDSAFDRDEPLSFDIIDQLQASSYF